MASTLTVDTIQGATAAANVVIPNHVIQVRQFFRPGLIGTNQTSLAELDSATFLDIMTKTITTKQANSKILVRAKLVGYNSAHDMRGQSKILRDSTEIARDRYAFYGPSQLMSTAFDEVLDTPNVSAGTTLTYKYQCANVGNGDLKVGHGDTGGGTNASLTLMEIAV